MHVRIFRAIVRATPDGIKMFFLKKETYRIRAVQTFAIINFHYLFLRLLCVLFWNIVSISEKCGDSENVDKNCTQVHNFGRIIQ